MAWCPIGHENPEGARFCTACGSSIDAAPRAATAPGWGPPAPPTAASAPAAPAGRPPTVAATAPAPLTTSWPPPPVTAPAGDPPVPPTAPRRSRGPIGWIVAAVVLALVIVAAAVVVAVGRTGDPDDERSGPADPTSSDQVLDDLMVVSTGRNGHGLLHLVRTGDPVGEAPAFAGGSVKRIGDLPGPLRTRPEGRVERSPIIPVPGGAIVAWRSGPATTVARVPLGGETPQTLYTGGGEATVGVTEDEAGDRHLLIEDGGECFAGPLAGPIRSVSEGSDQCEFQPGGRALTSTVVGRPPHQRRFALVSPDGRDEVVMEPRGSTASVFGNVVAISIGDPDSDTDLGTVLVDGRTGEPFQERQRPPLGPAPDGGAYLVAEGTGQPTIEEIDGTGKTLRTISGRALLVRSTSDGTMVAAATTAGDVHMSGGEVAGGTARIVALGREGDEDVELFTGPGARFAVLPDDRVLAWDDDGRMALGPVTAPLEALDVPAGVAGVHALSVASGPGRTGIVALVGDRTGDRSALAWIDDGAVRLLRWDGDRPKRSSIHDAGPLGVLVVGAAPGSERTIDAPDVLLLIDPDGRGTELARGGRIETPRFDGDEVVYQWRESDADDAPVEVRRVGTSGAAEPVRVVTGSLEAARASGAPVWSASAFGEGWVLPEWTCPGGPVVEELLPADDVDNGEQRFCVGGSGRPGTLEVQIQAGTAVRARLVDWAGVVDAFDPPSPAGNLRVRTTGSAYQLTVRAADEEAYDPVPMAITVRFVPDP